MSAASRLALAHAGRTPGEAAGPPVLLLCPPGSRIYQRDNYCSHESKASYYWYPYDLVVQSGILGTVGAVEVLDATALRLTPTAALARIGSGPYRAVLALMGAVCWTEDALFLRQVAAQTRAPLFVSGDVACAHPRQVLDSLPFVQGVLMDYTSPGLAQHLAGGTSRDLYQREQPAERPRKDGPGPSYAFPVPRWDLFPHERYRLPFQNERPFASVSASFGCPNKCAFCTAAPLTFKRRDLDNLFEELRFLAQAGYREIHFKDLSFAGDPPFYRALLDRLVREDLGFTFSCLARADELTPDLARQMKRAGCHLVHIGVESASEGTLERVQKGERLSDVKAAVAACQKEGIEVLASYMLGLPWESRKDVERTIDFAVALGTDYASFNTFTLRTGWPPTNREWPPETRARDYDLAAMQHRAYRRFYFRPSYVLGHLRSNLRPTRLRLATASGWEAPAETRAVVTAAPVTAASLAAAAASDEEPVTWCEDVRAFVGGLFSRLYSRNENLPPFSVDGRTGEALGTKDLLPELADYLPLLAAAGYRDYVQTQGEIVRRHLASQRLLLNPDPGLLPWLRRSNPFYYGDLILGLLECHALGLGEWWLAAAREQLDLVVHHFLRGDALVKEVTARWGLALPASESNALLVVELLVELHARGGDPRCLPLAEALVQPWRALAGTHGAVPQLRLLHPAMALIPRFAARRNRYPLYKHNLCYLSALWSLAEAGGDEPARGAAAEAALQAARFFRKSNGPYGHAVRRRGHSWAIGGATLKGTLLAEHLCDLGVACGRPDLLAEAESQCQWWLGKRDSQTGLIPYWEDGSDTDVDSLTDFAVTLLKVFAATGNETYREAAGGILRAMLKHHLGEFGLYRSVAVRNGTVRDPQVETRFTSLFLKPWLLLPAAEGLYSDPGLLSLMRDR